MVILRVVWFLYKVRIGSRQSWSSMICHNFLHSFPSRKFATRWKTRAIEVLLQCHGILFNNYSTTPSSKWEVFCCILYWCTISLLDVGDNWRPMQEFWSEMHATIRKCTFGNMVIFTFSSYKYIYIYCLDKTKGGGGVVFIFMWYILAWLW